MPHLILRKRGTVLLARILLTFPFWASGLAKLFDFRAGRAEMEHFGLEPPTTITLVTIIVQLLGSLSIITNRLAWLGAGALAVFTALTIPIVHHFWSMPDEPFRTIAFHTATEHVGMIGGLLAIAILSRLRARPSHGA